MISITESGPPVHEDEILLFERTLGAKLPSDYRRFLLAHNGGRPAPDTIDIEGLPGSGTDVQDFFGFDREFESSNLIWNVEIFADDLDDPTLLPIASDSGGNIFCIVTTGPEVGMIFFMDSVESVFYKYFVASSFQEFLSKLHD